MTLSCLTWKGWMRLLENQRPDTELEFSLLPLERLFFLSSDMRAGEAPGGHLASYLRAFAQEETESQERD